MNSEKDISGISPLEPAGKCSSKYPSHRYDQGLRIHLDPVTFTQTMEKLYDRKTAVSLLKQYGCRAGELLNIRWHDIIDNDVALMRASKRSRSRVIVIPGCTKAKTEIDPRMYKHSIFSCSYRQLLSFMLSQGIVDQPEGYTKRIITHLPRHQLAEQVNIMAGMRVAGDVLQHNARSSIKYYVPGWKRRTAPPPPPPVINPPVWTNWKGTIYWYVPFLASIVDGNDIPVSILHCGRLKLVGYPPQTWEWYDRPRDLLGYSTVILQELNCELGHSYVFQFKFDYGGKSYESVPKSSFFYWFP